jgi:hypothetical protein
MMCRIFIFAVLISGLAAPLGAAGLSGYTAEIKEPEQQGKTGESIYFTVVLNPREPASGYHVSTLVDVVDAPQMPEITTGFPRIRIVCNQAGIYKLMIRVSLVGKSSCGGVGYQPVAEQPVTLRIQ